MAEGEKAVTLFQRGRFTLADTEAAFDGWSNGEVWNGWAMPRFGFAVCREILKSFADEQARFDEKGDAFVTVSDGEEESWPGEQITISDGSRIKVYPLGAGSWIWEEA